VLDGRWTLLTDDKGGVSFDGLPSGSVVTYAPGGFPARRITLQPRPPGGLEDVTLP
jgi:hypothetical protein